MWKIIMCAVAWGGLSNAWAGPYDPIVSKVQVGESVPGQSTASLKLNLTTVKAVTLMSVSSPAAASVEIQSLIPSKGTMKVQVLRNLPIPEHRTISLPTQAIFLIMTGLKQPLKIGDRVPVTLDFAFADKKTKSISTEAVVSEMELSYKHFGPNTVYDHR
jgi:periplasmic copper chaperone A